MPRAEVSICQHGYIMVLLLLMTAGPVWAATPENAAAQSPARAQMLTEIEQYGITWTFAAPVPAGRFITGDWWVIGPVTIISVSPAPESNRNGSIVDPPAGRTQGYDDRIAGYRPELRAAFPLELRPGQALVSTHSLDQIGQKTPDTVRGQGARGPLRTAVVLTCLAEAPPVDAFRPAYCGDDRTIFTASQLRLDLLPQVKPVGNLPNVADLERQLERVWLDHMQEWVNRMMHPLENMPDYGREITNITSTTALLLCTEGAAEQYRELLLRFVQKGIDYWGITRSNNNLWIANGGHNSGRKIPILFAGVLFQHEGMKHVRATFAEDQQTYYGDGWRGQKVLWTINTESRRRHEHLPPEQWAEPTFQGPNNGWKSESYRALNGPTWVGSALAARLLGARELWNHPPFFDYVDRWVNEAQDGMIDRQSLQRRGYKPFPSDFVASMWATYRGQADEIGAEVQERSSRVSRTAR